ncbi:MAG: DUF4304 domain-containing protein [Luteolibacter sp.]|uniref:DUF4304 domain-containing protein n=1 Tax=Luteolibacter sp. TaxID=1962973 RepID=UPI0032663E8D
MQHLLKLLLIDLHTGYFKVNGFKKVRNKFLRELDGVIQEVEFQSSRWNTKGEAAVFYVNVGITFTDIATAEGTRGGRHGDGRMPGLIPGLPPQYELIETNLGVVRDELIANFPMLLEVIPSHYEDVRQLALKGFQTMIPMPDSWRKDH